MNRDEWLVTLCRTNDIEKAPTIPFTVRLGKKPFSFATDRMIVAVSAQEKKWPPPPPKDADATPPYEAYERVVDSVHRAQKTQREIGILDALILKEMAGEPNWEQEHVDGLWEDATHVFCINGTYYAKAVLARALAAWTEPVALVHQARILEHEPPCDILILTTEDMAIFISPYAKAEDSKAEIIELPDGAFAPAR